MEPEDQPEEPVKEDPAAALKERIPGPETNFREMLTDPKAIMDSAIAPLIFVGANSYLGLKPAAIAAGAWGVLTGIYRLVRKQKVTYAISGLIGLGIALALALRSGKASNYFLPNILIGAAYGAIALISVLIRHPASVFVARLVEGKPPEHYLQPFVRSTHMIVTLAWALFFLGRSGFRWVLVQQDRTGALAATGFLLGPVATAAMVAGTYGFLKWRHGSRDDS